MSKPTDRTRHGEWKPYSKLTKEELQYAIREPMQVFAGEIQSMARELLGLRAGISAALLQLPEGTDAAEILKNGIV